MIMPEVKPIPKSFYNKDYTSYQNELVNFSCFIQQTHPAFLMDPTMKERWMATLQVVQEALEREKHPTLPWFQTNLNRLLASLGDAHSMINIQSQTLFPFSLRYYDGQIYVRKIAKEQEELLGKVVTAIAGVPVDGLMRLFRAFFPAENMDKAGIAGSAFLNSADVLRAMDLLDKDGGVTLQLADGQSIHYSVADLNRPADAVLQPGLHPVTAQKEEYFCYQIVGRICYLQFNLMFDRWSYSLACDMACIPADENQLKALPSFAELLERMGQDMVAAGVTLLAVDMRYNGGGNSLLGDMLLDFLGVDRQAQKAPRVQTRTSDFWRDQYGKVAEKVTGDRMVDQSQLEEKLFQLPRVQGHYRGKVCFLQGQHTFSSACLLLTFVRDNGLFPTIGMPTSQKPTSYGDVLAFSLPYTHSLGNISHSFFQRPDTSRDQEEALFPEVQVRTPLEEYCAGGDRCWEYIQTLCG